MAEKCNPTLAQAAARVQAARAQCLQVGLYPNPVVGYQGSEIGNRIITLRDSVQAALLIVEAALRNRVSRGAHFIKADDN